MPKSRLTRLLATLFLALLLGQSTCAAFDEKFPGKGDYLKWQEANLSFDAGNLLFNAGSYDKAIEKYKQAIAIYPYDHEYFNYVGLSYKKKGDFQAAEEELKKAIDLKPSAWDSWSNIGSVYKHLGRVSEAKEAYAKALALNPPAKSKILLQQNIRSLEAVNLKMHTSPAVDTKSASPSP